MNDAKTYKRHRATTFTYALGQTVTSCADCGALLHRSKGKRIWCDDHESDRCEARNN
jgi:hypothetical protein